ncbi:hypothetical protein KZP23_19615 [Echinicola marina]|uniref:hypothetical protein n=1 Tax=Echinicola marina TaxID=2859768 RepID=UPI001CF70EE1|nr:hypothetical protein [Echinicola marina]UCS92854.1 hypothetical protein KZP23_19615 [Echinicola marina]
MKHLNFVLSLVLLGFLFSCESERKSIEYYEQPTGKLVFELDSLTPNAAHHMQLAEVNGKKLLYVLSPFGNRFVVFDFYSGKKVKEFSFPNSEEMPISIGEYHTGFYFHRPDSIFMVARGSNLFLGRESGDFDAVFRFRKEFPNDRTL